MTCSESLRIWDRFPVQGSPGPSTLPFRNPLFPYFYFSTNPSDHPGSVIGANLGETHYQQCPGGLGIWKCFGEEMGKKLTLENSLGGSKLQSGGPLEKGRLQRQLGFVFRQLWVSVALPMLAPGPPPQEGRGLPYVRGPLQGNSQPSFWGKLVAHNRATKVTGSAFIWSLGLSFIDWLADF